MRKQIAVVALLPLLTLLGILEGIGQIDGQEPRDASVETGVVPLPPGAVRRLGTARLRHGSRILCLAFSPNGKIIAAGGGDDPVRLWDARTGREIRTLNEPWVYALAFSPRGSVLASAGAFKTIRPWEVSTGKNLEPLKGHKAPVKSMAFSPDGTLIASGGQDGELRLWETVFTAKLITSLPGHTDEINSIAFDGQAKIMATGSGDRTIRLWDVDDTRFLRLIDGKCSVLAVALSPDGKVVASAGDDFLVRLWDTETAKSLGVLEGHKGPITSLLFTGDGKTLISGGHDKSIRLWDWQTQEETQVIRRGAGDSDALALSRDGRMLVAAGLNNTIRLWELPSGKEIVRSEQGPRSPISAIAISPDSRFVISANPEEKLRLWDLAAGKEIAQWGEPLGRETVLAYAPDGRTVAAVSGVGPIRLWDPATGAEKGKVAALLDEPILSLAFSPDSSDLAIGCRSQGILVVHVGDSKVRHHWKAPGAVQAVAFSQDGRTLAASTGDKIRLWDVDNGHEIRQLGKKEDVRLSLPAVAALAFSPDGKTLAAGGYDGFIRLWDSLTGKELRTIEGHTSAVYAVKFSADGRTLVSGSHDETVRLWEAFSGYQVAVYKGHRGPITSVALSTDGRLIVSGSTDTSMLVWDVTGRMEGGNLKPTELNLGEMLGAWTDLASLDAPRGHRAIWTLIAAENESLPFLAKQVFLVDPNHIQKLIKDLNAKSYNVRTRATAELAKYGIWIEGVLKDAQEKPPSEEVRRRIDMLLQKMKTPGALTLDQERLRARRVMLILEQLSNSPARELLEKLSKGAPETDLREEARGSLARLERRISASARNAR